LLTIRLFKWFLYIKKTEKKKGKKKNKKKKRKKKKLQGNVRQTRQ